VWEAGRATSAAPIFFAPQSIGNPARFFLDGGLRHNNPIRTFFNHYLLTDLTSYDEECYVSIGTGLPPNAPLEDTSWFRISSGISSLFLWDTLDVTAKAAVETESDHKWFKILVDARRGNGRTINYYRFNVPDGLGNIELDEVGRTGEIYTLTTNYLAQVRDDIDGCALALG